MSQIPTTEGEIPFHIPAAGKPCTTWYKVLGDLTSSAHPPLIVVHGGPGVPHVYLTPLEDLAIHHGFPVVFYDQVGCGRSTRLPERNGDTSFWTDELFMDEFDNLRKYLGIETYDALGHSWGGMLLTRIAARRPQGLRRLVLASTPSDIPIWEANLVVLRKRLPQDVQDVLDKHEKAGTTEDSEYQEAVGKFYARHICLLDPMPEGLATAFKGLEEDPTVYFTMYGPHEFDIRGPMRTWTCIPEIPKIAVPTLLLNGRDDEAQDVVMRPFFDRIPKVKWYTFAKSSHMAHYEERELYMQLVSDFLSDN